MKARLLLAVSGLLLMLPACSHMEHKENVAAKSYNDGLDHAYMNKVERSSRLTGVDVVWINPPRLVDTKAKPDDGHH
jgi:hypothetical protein